MSYKVCLVLAIARIFPQFCKIYEDDERSQVILMNATLVLEVWTQARKLLAKKYYHIGATLRNSQSLCTDICGQNIPAIYTKLHYFIKNHVNVLQLH